MKMSNDETLSNNFSFEATQKCPFTPTLYPVICLLLCPQQLNTAMNTKLEEAEYTCVQ